MRLLFAEKVKNGRPVTDSYGNQVVCSAVLDSDNMYVLFVDKNIGNYYIERVKNRFEIDIFKSENFEKIENDEEWEMYHQFFIRMGIIPPPPKG